MDSRFYKSFNIIVKITGLVFIVSQLSCSSSNSGGGIALYSVGGTVTGLQGSVTLRNNATDILTLSRSGDFSFNDKLSSGTNYNVDVQAQPSGETCTLNNASGNIVNADVTNIIVSCEAGVSVSGSYQVAPLIQVDSDINDPFAVANINNGSFFEAQTITNFSTVHGFVTLAGTSASTGTDRTVYRDRFASSEDEFDVYRANLQKNQTIRLQVADFADGDVDVFEGDLDLYLYDSGFNEVGFSDSTTEFENITVPADGDFYIVVTAFSGSSKYTLNLNIVTPLHITKQNSVDFMSGEAIIKFKPNTTISNFKTSQQQMALKHQKTTRATLASFDINSVSNASVSSRLKTKTGFIDELKQRNVGSYQKFKTLQQIKQLNLRQDVEYAEPNYLYKPLRVPNDEFYNLQWHYPVINLPQAWDITTGLRAGSDVIVAVVDTGVFLAHPELVNQLVDGYDFISDITNAADGDGIDANPDDPGDSAILNNSSWHGTHVAGTVAAESDNTGGIAGVAWQAKIMPLRVLGTLGGSSYDIIQAIRYAAGLDNDSGGVPVQQADIINLSLGGSGFSQAAQDTYNEVRSAGVIVVAAAGNENTSQLSYPASYDGVVSVSATGFDNARAPYSNYGSKIDVAAPGGNQAVDLNNDGYGDGVLSTLVDDSSGTPEATLKFYQGTSMAAPHVAGVIALMRAEYPALTPDDVDGLLMTGSITTDLGATGRDDIYGHGLLDALKAVQEAQRLNNGGVLPPLPALIVATPSQLTMGAISTATLLLSNEGGAAASITGVTDDAGWLSVTESNVDANSKLGEYQVNIDRTGLSDSSYLASITFVLDTGSSVEVQVSMDVGQIDKTGNAGTVYILLLDTNNSFVDQVLASDSGNGVFDYSFTNVIAGAYRVVAGSDIDNDLFICQLAEVCGGYPTIDALSTVDVIGSAITGLDFVVDIQASFGASKLSTDLKTDAPGFERRALPVMDNKQFSH